MNRTSCALTVAVLLGIVTASSPLAAQSTAITPSTADAIVGVWTLNKDLSDKPPERSEAGRSGRGPDGRGQRGGGPGGGGGRFGGGMGRGGGGMGRGRAPGDDDNRQRQMSVMRELMEAPDRLTITRTDAMVIITAGDGRTTRLSTDGKAVKDESTRTERKTRWSGDKLVSEISGLARGKITESYMAGGEQRRLTVTLVMDGARTPEGQPRTVTRVYDAEPR